jgi:hypothetical protein
MLKPAVTLDTDMRADAVLERLALSGFWLATDQPAARARLESLSLRLGKPVDNIARRLFRDARGFAGAIRRQWGTQVLWYARELQEVLERCAQAAPEALLIDVLGLHEPDASPTLRLRPDGATLLSTGVVMDDGQPVAVSFTAAPPAEAFGVSAAPPAAPSPSRSAAAPPAAPSPVREERAWPRVDAPEAIPALVPFEVTVGFAASPRAGVAGGQVSLTAAPGVESIDVTVELSAAPGVDAPDGWSRVMRVPLADVTSAAVTFQLVGGERPDPWHPLLTMLEVRYVMGGTVCGIAARPLTINHSSVTVAAPPPGYGEPWQAMATPAASIVLAADAQAPDLTIEITKPDRNAASGQYVCQLYSPHTLSAARGPFPMDLGQDAKTFAKAIVEEVGLFANSELLETTLEGIGRLVAQRLPGTVFDALHELATKLAPVVPAVLIASAEPYVPWELAWVEHPVDSARPAYLGCQADVGRWLRDNDASDTSGQDIQRPATQPVSRLAVRNIAVMAAWYKAQTGLRRLPMAEEEARTIVEQHQGLALAASAQSMRQFLSATLESGFNRIGGVEAAHFAGHGDFDPTRPDGSALFLEDGTPMRSNQFRAAKYGGPQQPLMFLNACMLGIGGELLGDMGGFPGNSLRGGFGGVLGALWEVDDTVARDIALEFWQRALPPTPRSGEPIGAILRDIRSRFLSVAGSVPVSTYLAYVYYGHPRLTLERM